MPAPYVEELVALWEESPGTIMAVENYCEFCYTAPVALIIIGRDAYFLCKKHRLEFTQQLAGNMPDCNCVTLDIEGNDQSCAVCKEVARGVDDKELPF